MLTPQDLLRLANIYSATERIALSTLGKRACGNNKVFRRIAAGAGANSDTLQKIEGYFRVVWSGSSAHWPDDIIPGPAEPRQSAQRRKAPCDGGEVPRPEPVR